MSLLRNYRTCYEVEVVDDRVAVFLQNKPDMRYPTSSTAQRHVLMAAELDNQTFGGYSRDTFHVSGITFPQCYAIGGGYRR